MLDTRGYRTITGRIKRRLPKQQKEVISNNHLRWWHAFYISCSLAVQVVWSLMFTITFCTLVFVSINKEHFEVIDQYSTWSSSRDAQRAYGAELCYTPMIHGGLCLKNKDHFEQVFSTDAKDRPLFAQFCANTPEAFLFGARLAEGRCDAVDLNLGCPQGIAKRGHYGAFLLEETHLVRDMISTVHLHCKTPVTAKIRILPNPKDTIHLAKLIEASGAQVLAVHGRTKEMLKTKIGSCDFDIIRQIKNELRIPVFSNGGIETFEDVARCTNETGVDGVMSSEAVLENPALFSGKNVDPIDLADQYLDCVKKYPSPLAQKAMRPHMFKFLFRELTHYSDMRQQLGQSKINSVDLPAALRTRRDRDKSTEAIAAQPSWYKRHRAREAENERKRAEKEREKAEAKRKLVCSCYCSGTRARLN